MSHDEEFYRNGYAAMCEKVIVKEQTITGLKRHLSEKDSEIARLRQHLEKVLEAWDYNGGGDSWTRECYEKEIEGARAALAGDGTRERSSANLTIGEPKP